MNAMAIGALLGVLTIPVVNYAGPPQQRAIVDTGGMTESSAMAPQDFASVYRGLGVTYALGVDYLSHTAVKAGRTTSMPKRTVKLDVRTSSPWTVAFVDCTIGNRSYRMLLDTVALAWPSATTSRPRAVVYLSTTAFETVHRGHPRWPYHSGGEWIVDSHGFFVQAASLTAPTNCGGVLASSILVVERKDASTYTFLKQHFGLTVDGDVSLAAFSARGITIDFPRRALDLY